MTRAVVVGSGPNGLTAACALAEAGLAVEVLEAAGTIGGGTRTSELTVPGVLHDHCSAVHPMGVVSPAFKALGLDQHGLSWCWPDIDLAHPLDGGRAGVMVRSLAQTASGLDAAAPGDGRRWRGLFSPFSTSMEALYDDLLQPLTHLPRHPLLLARFGPLALSPAALVARLWHGDEARALWGGAAAHALRPFESAASASVGLALLSTGHSVGWPVARGGSRSITDALATKLASLGGSITTGVPVSELGMLDRSDVVMLDTSPRAAAGIVGPALPERVRRAWLRYRYGPAAYKIDLAVDGGIPWTAAPARRAGTVHVAGTFEEMSAAEADVAAGRMPARPYVLLSQPAVADPSRAAGDIVPIWAYAHVPNGYAGDATEAILGQVERFAPGFRERIAASAVRTPTEFESYNANYVGGDIVCGANDLRQVALRPRFSMDPYFSGVPGIYLCSAATPPGAGVHGMCGWNAARAALRRLSG